ncbi:DNA/RNA non-specific endonuclease [Shewanella psychrophila]|uniref:DNA/RNA non-specific endonuclease n=1 Tax=Shewanella psychrophila TaxID=225848 RepID=UPI00098B2E2A|nr:DNA/RNA non-specific endonuclease [Shewanella psychrophila]
MENKWADALKGDPPKKVNVSIDAIYDKNSNRPEAFDVTYLIDGKKKSVTLINQPRG